MKEEYDFSEAVRGPVAKGKGKTRITIMLDDDVIEAARHRAESAGTGYQTIINNLLRQALIAKGTYPLAPHSREGTAGPYHINEGVGPSNVEALEQQLIAMARELKRVLG